MLIQKIKNLIRFYILREKPNIAPVTPLFTKDIPKYKDFSIGYGTYGEPEVLDWKDGSTLKIGNYCSIAGVTIFLGGEHLIKSPSTYPFESIALKVNNIDTSIVSDRHTKGDVIIGSDVWIGHKSTILSGVTIGDGVVIGACAIVAKDVPAYAVVVGNPAKIIKYRFKEKEIEEMLNIKWWNWPEQRIYQLSEDFKLPIEQFISKHLNSNFQISDK